MKIREKFYQTSPLKASRTSCYGRLVMNKAVRESTPRHRAMPAGKLVTVQSSECASVLTSPSWADCGAADRAGLVSWMISRWATMDKSTDISCVLVFGLSVYCLTVNLPWRWRYDDNTQPYHHITSHHITYPYDSGLGDKEATTKQKQMERKSRMTEWTFMAENRCIAHSFCNEN